MKTNWFLRALFRYRWLAAILSLAVQANAQFVSYVDYIAGPRTHTNATRWNCAGLSCLPTNFTLREITTGLPLSVTATVSEGGFATASGGAFNPAPGTPCYQTFNGFVDFTNSIIIVGLNSTNDSIIYTFNGLDPSKQYNFKGAAVRGNSAYTNRWSLFEIVGADSFGSAHTVNCLTSTSGVGLTVSQVAINTGVNHTPPTGDMAVWKNIEPGADGSFAVTCKQYRGTVPGGSSEGTHSYAIAGIRLEEVDHLRLKIGPDPATPGNLLLYWSNEAAVLQSTSNFNDGWKDVISLGGSYSVTPLGTMFYRLRLGP